MDPIKKQAWIDALRSGDYQKSKITTTYGENTCALHDKNNDTYCALGVYAVINGGKFGVFDGFYQLSKDDGTPDSDYTMFKKDGIPVNDIYSRNDGFAGNVPYSFEQMADYIEKHL